MHLGTDHLTRLRILRKLAAIRILMEQHLEAFYNILEAVEIIKCQKRIFTLDMSYVINDALRLAMDVGVNDQAFELGILGQKIHLEYIRDGSNHQLDFPVEKRSEIFSQLLNGFYVNCK